MTPALKEFWEEEKVDESAGRWERRGSAGRRCTSCPSAAVRHVSSPTPHSSAVMLSVPTVATTTAVVSMTVAGGVVSIARLHLEGGLII